MAWIESHQALGHHPKTVALATALGCNLPAAVGYLQYLWWWALDVAPTGAIPRTSIPLLAKECHWHRNPNRFWQALVDAGFIDATDEGGTIHDWYDYAGRLIEKRSANRNRMRAARATNSARTVHDPRARTVQGYQPDQPNQPVNAAAAAETPAPVAHVRARGDGGPQPLGRFLAHQQRRQRQDLDSYPDEVRETLNRPAIEESAAC